MAKRMTPTQIVAHKRALKAAQMKRYRDRVNAAARRVKARGPDPAHERWWDSVNRVLTGRNLPELTWMEAVDAYNFYLDLQKR